jgi:uroporphyrinogen III methyltransferase/synthase
VQASGLTAPTIVIIGPVVKLRPTASWFESRPLFGKQILVTRPRALAASMVQSLEELGAVVHRCPVVDIAEPTDWAAADKALTSLERFQWLVFTSVNGVQAVMRRLGQLGRDLRALGSVRLAAIGPATADALRMYYLQADLIPREYTSESLAAQLKVRAAGQRVLLARADRGRDVLRQQLAAVCEVVQVTVYSQHDEFQLEADVRELLRQGRIAYVTLTSSNIARAFVRALDEETRASTRSGTPRLVTISPVTSAAVSELGFPVAAEAREATSAGVVAAVVELAQRYQNVTEGP